MIDSTSKEKFLTSKLFLTSNNYIAILDKECYTIKGIIEKDNINEKRRVHILGMILLLVKNNLDVKNFSLEIESTSFLSISSKIFLNLVDSSLLFIFFFSQFIV
jgi:hypothetical protein